MTRIDDNRALLAADQSARETVPALLRADDLAPIIGCSRRQVHRLRGQGLIPGPVKIGGLVRWSRAAIERWIESGCPAVNVREEATRE